MSADKTNSTVRSYRGKHIRSLLFTMISVAFLIFILFCSFTENQAKEKSIEVISAQTPVIPDKMNFCDEDVPLEYFDVKESLEREILVNTFFHSQTILYIKKAGRFFPVIEPILKTYNIPDDFKYLAVAESGLSYVVSPAGATGFWQLLKGTAMDYGLVVNDEVDERYHLEKSTVAACKFLQESYDKYQNWTLVAASYNAGRRGVDRQIENQGETDYYNLLFNEETARYVFRILAIKLILENPDDYGFNISENELYNPIPCKELIINSSVEDWGEFAKANGTNYKILKLLNPWLRDRKLSNQSNKEYIIKVPLQGNR